MVNTVLRAVRVSAVSALIACAALVLPATATADPASLQKLLGELPRGYTSANCDPAQNLGSQTALAGVDCGFNHAPGGPQQGWLNIYANAGDLNADFTHDANFDNVQPNPDGSTGPQTWSRTATPNQPAGSYFFLKAPNGELGMEWMDTTKLVLGAGGVSTDSAALLKWLTNT